MLLSISVPRSDQCTFKRQPRDTCPIRRLASPAGRFWHRVVMLEGSRWLRVRPLRPRRLRPRRPRPHDLVTLESLRPHNGAQQTQRRAAGPRQLPPVHAADAHQQTRPRRRWRGLVQDRSRQWIREYPRRSFSLWGQLDCILIKATSSRLVFSRWSSWGNQLLFYSETVLWSSSFLKDF